MRQPFNAVRPALGMWAALAVICFFPSTGCAQPRNPWESVVAKFEAQDREHPPEPGGIVFVGSSSIRLWNLDKSFPEMNVLNRGFGGSHASDAAYFAKRLVTAYRPRLVVFYAGDNDLAAGKSPDSVRDDVRAFVDTVHAELPDAKILLLSIKPSPSRWKLIEQQKRANELVQKLAEDDKRLKYVDVAGGLLGPDGRPRRELFLPDELHLSEAGYRVWTEILTPLLK